MPSAIRVVLWLLLSSRSTTAFLAPSPNSRENLYSRRRRKQCLQKASVETDASSSCPFSKVFPRYRIDLTTTKEDKKDKGFEIPLFTDLGKNLDRIKLSQAHRGDGVPIQWADDKSGVQATAALWRHAADLMRSTSIDTVFLALPDATAKEVRQWVDIMEWMGSQQQLTGDSDSTTSIQAVFDDTTMPTVKLIRSGPAITAPSTRIEDPSIIEKRMQSWVKRILVDLGVCPFTKSTKMSGQGLADLGVPVARIAYHTSNAAKTDIYTLLADTWQAIGDMIEAGPCGKQGVSSILLAAPGFDQDFDLWSGPVFALLEAGVCAAGLERQIGVVCFHNQYATPDGSTWPGFGHMHSVKRLQQWLTQQEPDSDLSTDEVAAGGAWQRRTPHATINVLRADQLEAAEGRRTTGELYSENILKLVGRPDGIGSGKLQQDLDNERSMQSIS